MNEDKDLDYVKYDDIAMSVQADFKQLTLQIRALIRNNLHAPRAKALALTKSEEFYMWVGKAIRDDQIGRNGTAELQEGRGNE